MSTQSNPDKKPWYKTGRGITILIIVLFVIGIVGACSGSDDEADSTATETTTEQSPVEETTPEEETTVEEVAEEASAETVVEDPAPANVAEGVDPNTGPQDWWSEYYQERNCVSQDIRYGGIAICMARGVDMANDDTMLVFYVDQDEAGVQDHFSMEPRQQMFVDSLAGIVSAARADGEPRVQHVTDVRVIATGGEGFFSGWQGEAETY